METIEIISKTIKVVIGAKTNSFIPSDLQQQKILLKTKDDGTDLAILFLAEN